MGMDFAEELRALGRQVRTFAYRRDNPLYKNRGTKAAYQRWILRRLERVCLAWRPSVVLVIKGGPITPALIRRVKSRLDIAFVNFFPDNPLWMLPSRRSRRTTSSSRRSVTRSGASSRSGSATSRTCRCTAFRARTTP